MRSRLTFANIMSVVAVFIALGGSATAAILITGKNVKNGSLTGTDLKDNSVRSKDVKNGDLLAKDFKKGQLPAGPQGAQGLQGTKGDTGQQGDAGPSDAYVGAADGGTLSMSVASQTDVASITVPAGSYVLQAKIDIAADADNTSSEVQCSLQSTLGPGPTYFDAAVVTTPAPNTNNGKAVLSLAGAGAFSGEQPVHLACFVSNTNAAFFYNARIWATRVGNLHATLPLPVD